MIETNITKYGVDIETSITISGVRIAGTSDKEKIIYDENGEEVAREIICTVEFEEFEVNSRRPAK